MKLNKFFPFTLLFVFGGVFAYSQKIYLEVIQKGDSIELVEKSIVPTQIKPTYPTFKSPVHVTPKINIEPAKETPKVSEVKVEKKDAIIENKKDKRKLRREKRNNNQPIVEKKIVEPNQEGKKEIIPVIEPEIVINDNYIYNLPTDIDEVPVYKGCEQFFSKQSRIVCMKNKIFNEIFKHLYFPPSAYEKGIEGSVIFEYLIDKDGRVLPYAINPNDKIYKEVVFSAIKKWLVETKEFKTKPAIKNNAPVKFSDFVVFSMKFQKGKTNTNTQQNFNPKSFDRNRVKIIPTEKKQK